MNPILPAMTVLALLVGSSGCLFVRDRWDPREIGKRIGTRKGIRTTRGATARATAGATAATAVELGNVG